MNQKRAAFWIKLLFGGAYIYLMLALAWRVIFGESIFEGPAKYIIIMPIVVLFPGWGIPLGKSTKLTNVLGWMLITAVVCFCVVFLGR